MAKVENKTERKKLISAELIGTICVMHRLDTQAELGRVDLAKMTDDIKLQTLFYGTKQACSDPCSALTGEEKFAGITRNLASLASGVWPSRESKPVSVDAAAELLAKSMGMTRDQMMELLNSRKG